MRASFLPAVAAAVLLCTPVAAQTSAPVTALTGATLIDGTGAPPSPNATIVMENGRIRDIGPSRGLASGQAPPSSTSPASS